MFASARSALEALAVGASVVVYWWCRLGPVVTIEELERLRRENFGMRAMGRELLPDEFGSEVEGALARYDAAKAARVSERVRMEAGRERSVREFVDLYESVIEEHAAGPMRNEEAEARAAAAYVRARSLSKGKDYEALYDSATFRLRGRLLRLPLVGGVARALTRVTAGTRRPTRNEG